MRAAMFNGPGCPITIENLADPRPGPGELLVKVARCGICGSDVSMSGEGPMNLPLGRFGHEWAGEIVEVGRGVAGWRVGDRIAGLPAARCGECDGCRSRNPLFCERVGYLVGGFAEYMLIPPVAAVALPQSLSWTDGALVEPMTCGIHALRFAAMQPGDPILILGAGAMALSAIFWAREMGAGRIAVLSRSPHRAEAAMAMGADAVLGFDEEGHRKVVETLGSAPAIVAECVGKLGMLELAIGHVAPRGAVLSLGMCQHGDPVVPAIWSHKEIRLLFPRAYTVDEFAETARAFDKGRIRPEIMVSDTIGLDALPDMMEALRGGGRKALKVHVDPAG
jgi:(R,R)-butanediol dehydrogenase/meso-butanediol dehydrogenase/diacetyl reductase